MNCPSGSAWELLGYILCAVLSVYGIAFPVLLYRLFRERARAEKEFQNAQDRVRETRRRFEGDGRGR